MARKTLLLAVAVAVGAIAAAPASAWEPKGQGECIAPANPGGGWDMTCRALSAVMLKAGVY